MFSLGATTHSEDSLLGLAMDSNIFFEGTNP
jgi:hypothetical protein